MKPEVHGTKGLSIQSLSRGKLDGYGDRGERLRDLSQLGHVLLHVMGAWRAKRNDDLSGMVEDGTPVAVLGMPSELAERIVMLPLVKYYDLWPARALWWSQFWMTSM